MYILNREYLNCNLSTCLRVTDLRYLRVVNVVRWDGRGGRGGGRSTVSY